MLGLSIPTLISRILILLIAFSIHEFAHAWMADQFGDDTPRLHGRLTLNPLSHLDPIGSLMLVIAGFGWAKPVPVNAYALQRRHPAALMMVSASGPVSNLLLALLASLPFGLGLLALSPTQSGSLLPSASSFMVELIFINLILFFFNLVPIFPLDGEKVAEFFLPPAGKSTLQRMRPYGTLILLGLLFIAPRFGIDIFGWLIVRPAQQILQYLVL